MVMKLWGAMVALAKAATEATAGVQVEGWEAVKTASVGFGPIESAMESA